MTLCQKFVDCSERDTAMAKFNPPENFNFERPGDWPAWRQRFTRYRSAAKLSLEDGEVQVSTLIYAMGNEAENIFKSFIFADGEKDDNYDTVLAKFDNYFTPKKNVIHERACFHMRVQKVGETAESFIKALYELSENCDFGQSRSEHIRDRLVVGIRDKEVSRRLQLMSDLTLEKAIQTVQQAEDVALQISQLEEQATLNAQEVTHLRGGRKGGKQPATVKSDKRENDHQGEPKCCRCGKTKRKSPGLPDNSRKRQALKKGRQVWISEENIAQVSRWKMENVIAI
ncbi:hypothetical protein GJAV_G00168980 [Gymnothorax javanicus]|nr:hypothetical protein GJAV_G00168980 [Gymnothorax javanicus]